VQLLQAIEMKKVCSKTRAIPIQWITLGIRKRDKTKRRCFNSSFHWDKTGRHGIKDIVEDICRSRIKNPTVRPKSEKSDVVGKIHLCARRVVPSDQANSTHLDGWNGGELELDRGVFSSIYAFPWVQSADRDLSSRLSLALHRIANAPTRLNQSTTPG
jgi:hypothetical protein